MIRGERDADPAGALGDRPARRPAGRGAGPAGGAPEERILEIADERLPLAKEALSVIAEAFPRHERQPVEELRLEVAEKRLALLSSYEFHLLTMARGDTAMGSVVGVYLEGVNAGFITYLAVRPEFRGRSVAPRLRARLLDRFRADARQAEYDELDWAVGEVRADNPWLARLVRSRGIIPFDLEYRHPGIPAGTPAARYVLYRQPIGDTSDDIPVDRVRRLLYAIYRRAYRIRYPLGLGSFLDMLEQLEGRETVGAHPEFAG